jgi:capsular exopolysaccharide synthesis family protein
LSTQLPDLELKLQKSAAELSEFKNRHDIVSSTLEDKLTMVNQRLAKITDELTSARLKKATLKARYEVISALLKDQSISAGQGGLIPIQLAVVQPLKFKVMDLRTECTDLEERMLPQHPKLVSCKTRLAAAEQALQREIETAMLSARAELNEIVGAEKNLLQDLAEAKLEAQEANKHEPEYLRLKRVHEYNLKLYEVALRSLRESGLSGSTRLNNVSMLDSARPPSSPAKPNVQQILLIGAVIGLLLGLALAFGIEFLDNTIKSQEQIEERLGLTFLGILPTISDKADASRDLIVAEQPKSAVAECCRAVRANLMFMSPERPLRSILVTSAGPRDGKTTTAASLAITMAKSGSCVLLVDADMRRPRVHSAFKVPNGLGLSSLILGEGTLDKTVKSSGIENLSILTCGPVPPNPADLLHTQVFENLLKEMAATYDRIIIDSPPVGAVADAVVMSTHVDGTVLVLKSGVTARDMAKRTVRALRDVKARIFGAVLNDIDLEDRQAGGYYYYTKYGYYYGDSEATSKDGSESP